MSNFPDNNPYNFIPLGEEPVRITAEPPSHRLLQGLSGTIILKLTNETPLLVAQRVNPPEEIPPKLECFKVDGKPVLPGTSLKGMVRSVLEALTNACWVVFDQEALDYRLPGQEALQLKPGRVVRMPGDGQPGQVELMDKAWVAMQGKPNTVKVWHGGKWQSVTLATVSSDYHSGQEVWVKHIRVNKYRNSQRRVINATFNLVTHISQKPQSGYSRAILKITRQSIDNKKRERAFVFLSSPRPQLFEFGDEDVAEYNKILAGQMAEWEKRQDFDLEEKDPLNVGHLVYFLPQETQARHLSRVEIPRRPYNQSRGALLPKIYHRCTDPANLCAACQLFGFVAGINSARGRISITDAIWQNGPGELEDFFPLMVLGKPHPTSCNFYLIDPSDSSQVRNYDGLRVERRGRLEHPEGKVQLRGRKFYYHHPSKGWAAYKCPNPEEHRKHLSEVRPLKPGNSFKFWVHFRNLSKAELGLLLYSLVLEDNLRHKLGLGKPLGFGTVKVECLSLKVSRDGERYTTLETSDQEETGNLSLYVGAFHQAVEKLLEKKFDDLENVQKLKKILDPRQAPRNPSYPPDGFRWYRDHKHVALKPL